MLVAAGIVVLAGCGGDAEPGDATEPLTEIRVTVWPDGRGGSELHATLRCDPTGGDHPTPEAACRALREHPDAVARVPRDAVCTQVFGGTQEAEIEGTLAGRPVRASFDRRNGCEIARWERLAPLFALERP